MVAYIIRVIPLIKCLKATYPDVDQPWYSENANALGVFDNIRLYFNFLKHSVLSRGYLPQTFKKRHNRESE